MTRADLSPVMMKAYDALSEQDREAFLEQMQESHAQVMRGATARIQARCLSHHIGNHMMKVPK